MRTPNILLGLATGLLLGTGLAAQVCPDAGDTFWKNDILEDAPVGMPAGATVIVAVCNDDAMGTVFDMPPGTPPQHIKQVSMGFGHTGGQTNHGAVVSIEIYQGQVTWNPGGNIIMPTKIFDSLEDLGQTVALFSTGITAFNIEPLNVIVDDDFIVVFRMIANASFPGCPDAIPGSAANILSDGNGPCNPQVNVLDERNVGWVDPADWQFTLGQTICPQFFTGNWVIRACTEDAGTWTDLGNSLAGSTLPALEGSGPQTGGSINTLALTNALTNTISTIFLGVAEINAPFKGGVLVPTPDFVLAGIPTGPLGGWEIDLEWAQGLPGGLSLYWQIWVVDGGGPAGLAASNGVRSTTP